MSHSKMSHKEILPTQSYINWQRGLAKSQSYSALSLFATTFSKAVNWSFINPLGQCQICKRDVYESYKPQFCAKCGDAYHLKCARVRSQDIDWLCRACVLTASAEINDETNTFENNYQKNDKRASKRRVDWSPTPSSSSGNTFNSRSIERNESDETNVENEHVEQKNIFAGTALLMSGTRKRKPVRKYGEFVYNEDLDQGNESTDSLYEFFGRKSVTENNQKRKKKELDDDVHIRSISMGLRESGVGRSKKELIRLWENALYDARKQPFAEPFNELVDKKFLPQYYDVIKDPMALRTIIQKIKAYEYDTTAEVWADCELIFKNCETFNDEGSPIIMQCEELRNFLKAKFDVI